MCRLLAPGGNATRDISVQYIALQALSPKAQGISAQAFGYYRQGREAPAMYLPNMCVPMQGTGNAGRDKA
jgi:hypothetical protein